MIILSVLALSASLLNSQCEVVILGGTLAGLAAALEAPPGRRVCLVEPTSRLGGQLGDEGVWHIDFNWFYQPGYPDRTVAYNPANLHPVFRKLSSACNSGNCWVSRNCFTYDCFSQFINLPSNVEVFWNSMVVNLTRDGPNISSLTIVQRTAKGKDCRQAGVRLQDWYSKKDSQFYSKQVITLSVKGVLVQASQYGDALVLAKSYQQGLPQNQNCGQSIVFGLHQVYDSARQSVGSAPIAEQSDFSLDNFTVEQVWRYRRLIGKGTSINEGQLSLQNWNGPGNDFKRGYIYLSRANTSLLDYLGGINFTVLSMAEQRSIDYHFWFKNISGLPLQPTNQYFGGCNGLSPLPYIRDGRRAVGYKGFQLTVSDVTGEYKPGGPLTARPFEDRVALGYYNIDIHPIQGCSYDQKVKSNTSLPFFIPLRALSSTAASNLVVAGRAMAQDFYASSATRTHVTEFNSGVAAAKTAGLMLADRVGLWNIIDNSSKINRLQSLIRQTMPLEWTINGSTYPARQVQ